MPQNQARSFLVTSLIAICLGCSHSVEEASRPIFLVERVPSTNETFSRAELPLLRNRGHLSASVRLHQETRRALIPSLPSKLTFAVRLPERPVLQFAVAVGTQGRLDPWVPVEFRLGLNAGRGEKTLFREVIRRPERNRWLDRELDLASWSGAEAQLSLEVGAVPGSGPGSEDETVFPIWGHPVISSASSRDERPHLILISVDCLRPDHMGLYGYGRKTTPRLDAFAREAVVFETAISPSSWTLPAHMSMLTGLTPSFHGASRTQKLAPSIPYLPELLSQTGYEAAGVVSGAYLSSAFGFARGFHRYLELDRPRARETVDRALERLERAESRSLFLFIHLFDAHWRYLPPEDFVDRFGPRPARLHSLLNKVLERQEPSSPEEIQQLVNLYDGEIAYVDQEVGRLLEALKETGLYDRSLVVLTSDHGEAFYEHGYWQHSDTLYEEMIRVPLVIKWPGGAPRGRVDDPVSPTAIFSTVLEASGLELPERRQMSLIHYLGAGSPPPAARVISETTWESENRTAMKIAFRGRDFKYIATFAGKIGEELTVERMIQEELYHLATDPGEKRNLTTSPRLERFRQDLHAYLKEARDYRARSRSGRPVVLDEEIEKRLRSLGYIH